jgi:hypothetical protein
LLQPVLLLGRLVLSWKGLTLVLAVAVADKLNILGMILLPV